MTDIKKMTSPMDELMQEAADELNKENVKKWKRELKAKMVQLQQAKTLVANCERELEDLQVKIGQEMV